MKTQSSLQKQVEKLLKREKALAQFGTFAFSEPKLDKILSEAARVCAECLGVPFAKVCKYRQPENDLLVVAGHGWHAGVVDYAISVANETSPQGRAFSTGEPQVCSNIGEANAYTLPPFYVDHGIVSTADVLVAAKIGVPFGVLEVDSPLRNAFKQHDIDFLTGFANILAEAVATSERSDALRQAVARMEELMAEKDTLAQELKHRVRNSLHLVFGLLTSEINARHEQDDVNAFRSIALRVMGLAEVFEHLLGGGMNGIINFGDYVGALCDNLPDLFGDHDVKLVSSVEPVCIDLEVATSLGIVITELVSNAYMHAFPAGRGEICVALSVAPGGAVLSVTDDGVGFTQVETKRRGVGLVRRLVKQVGGTLSLRSDQGTAWIIGFSAPEPSSQLLGCRAGLLIR